MDIPMGYWYTSYNIPLGSPLMTGIFPKPPAVTIAGILLLVPWWSPAAPVPELCSNAPSTKPRKGYRYTPGWHLLIILCEENEGNLTGKYGKKYYDRHLDTLRRNWSNKGNTTEKWETNCRKKHWNIEFKVLHSQTNPHQTPHIERSWIKRSASLRLPGGPRLLAESQVFSCGKQTGRPW